MLLMLLDTKEYEFEAVFVDTGCEYPETYEYVEMVNRDIYPIKIIDSGATHHGRNLLLHCIRLNIVPVVMRRWCTADFKIGPLHKYFEKPCYVDIGIALEEKHRQRVSIKPGIEHCYPLIENGIDREGCKRIIASHGLPIPRKSGCWICPMMRMSEVRALYNDYPCFYEQLKALEDASIQRQIERGRDKIGYWHASNKPLDVIVHADQEVLFPEHRQPCECAY